MLLYYLVIPFLLFLAWLPGNFLYKLSDVLAFVLYDVVKYRRKVVYDNLKKSFPEKNEAELQAIAKESYRHLADRVIENIKCISISKEEVNNRMFVHNEDLLRQWYEEKRNVVMVLGHLNAWEYGVYRLAQVCDYKLYGLVARVQNDYFNRMIQRTRGKMGMELVMTDESKQFFEKELTQLSLVAFIADQSPSNSAKAYWTDFLHQPTGFLTGADRYARQHKCAVVYAKIVQDGKGHYLGGYIPITLDASKEPENFVTERFARILEEQIREAPANWLWSHKRWKHKPVNSQ